MIKITPPQQERDERFDTLKFILIVIVVFGHVIMALKNRGRCETAMFNFIYSFHMPLFVFISGYFTRIGDKSPKAVNASFSFLSLFLISNALMWIVYPRSLRMLVTPNYGMWYLLSMFYWRLFSSFKMKESWLTMKGLCIVTAVSALVGIVPFVGEMFSFNRTICFFCFFFAGMMCRKSGAMEWIAKIPVWLAIVVFPFFFLLFYWIFSEKLMYVYSESYGFSLKAMMTRMFQMGVAVVLGSCFIRLSFLVKNRLFARLGSQTLFFYLYGLYITASMTTLSRFVVIPHGMAMALAYTVVIMFLLTYQTKNRVLNRYLQYNMFESWIQKKRKAER